PRQGPDARGAAGGGAERRDRRHLPGPAHSLRRQGVPYRHDGRDVPAHRRGARHSVAVYADRLLVEQRPPCHLGAASSAPERGEAAGGGAGWARGQQIEADVIGVATRYYPDNRESKLEDDALAAGFPSFSWADSPEAIQFALSPEGEAIVKEMERIIQGG